MVTEEVVGMETRGAAPEEGSCTTATGGVLAVGGLFTTGSFFGTNELAAADCG